MGNNGGRRPGSGRKPIPAAIKRALGTTQTKEQIARQEAHEPKIEKDALKKPDFLTDYAKEEWDRVIELIGELGVLNSLDLYTLSAYCEAVSVFRNAQEQWKKNQQVIGIDDNGRYLPNPYLRILKEQTLLINKLSEQLSLTPVGRARLGIAKSQEPTQFEKFLMDDE